MTQLNNLELCMIRNIAFFMHGVSRAPHLATVKIICPVALHQPPPSVSALDDYRQTQATSPVRITLRLRQDIASSSFASIDSHRFTLLTLE